MRKTNRFLMAAVLGLIVMRAASAQVVVNEIYTGAPDWCEIANLGTQPVLIGGWTIFMNDDPNVSTPLTFPAGTIIAPGEVILISENATTPAVGGGVQRFTSANINWAINSGGSVGLNNAQGVGIDLVIFGNGVFLPVQTPAPPWTGSVPAGGGANTQDYLRRTTSTDTNSPADWTMSGAGSETPGALNPGQTAPAAGPLTVSFTATQTSVAVGATVKFVDTSSGIATSWAWDFENDGIVDSNVQHPTFSYAVPGSYTVKLTATNSFGSASATVTNFITVIGAPTATAPYTESFSGVALGPEWTLTTGVPNGRIQFGLEPSGVPSPLSGGNGMVMDVSVSGTTVTNIATLNVNLAATGGATLKYMIRETADEDDADDGVFLSNGITTIQLTSHAGTIVNWTEFSVDLAAAAANAGMALTSNMQLRFQQRDNFPIPTDGAIYDDVRLELPLVPDTGQANQPTARLDINGGLNLNGRPATDGENGPFFSSGETMTITVGGTPNQPYVLIFGGLNRDNEVFPGIGSIDVGFGGATNNYSDITVVVNGAGGPEFWDLFAVLDAGGQSVLTFGVGAFPPGVFGTIQALVYTGGPSVIASSAAFEFTVAP